MDGERARIKKMSDEGKISPVEARRLLDALERNRETAAPEIPAQASPSGGGMAPRSRLNLYASLVFFSILTISLAVALYKAGYISRAVNGGDLLLNGGFETGEGEKVSMWAPSAASDPFWGGDGGGGGAFSRDGFVAYKGSHSVSITGSAQGGALSWRQRLLTFPAGKKLVLTGYVKTSGITGPGASLAIRGLKELNSETFISTSAMSFDLTGTGDWTMVRVHAVVEEGTREIQVLCLLDGAGTAWYDELRLTAGD